MNETPDELERIRQRKLQALIEKQQQIEAAKEETIEQGKKRSKLLQLIFFPDAIAYLRELRQAKPDLATRIEDIAITLFAQRYLVNRISKIGVQIVQRRLEGVESRITVKRRGEDAVSFYEAVRKDLTESE